MVETTQEVQQDKSIAKLTAGDYTIHVFLQKFKDLALPDDSTETIKIEISADRDKEYSKDYPNTSNSTQTTMGEHIFIEKRNQTMNDLQNLKLKVKVLIKSVWKNVLIGLYEFDFSYIYFMKNHMMEHCWLAISNPNSEDFSQIQGLVKLSISIHGEKDNPMKLEMDSNPHNDTNVMMSSAIKPEFKQIKLHIFKAENLPKMDRATVLKEGKMDAFFRADFGEKKLRTSTVTSVKDESTWNETMLIPVRIPFVTSRLVLKLYDEDMDTEEICGSLHLDYKTLLEQESGDMFWLNVYGPEGGDEQGMVKSVLAAVGSRSEEFNDMCNNPEHANNWKCRVLVAVEHFKCDQPRFAREKIQNAQLIKRAQEMMNPKPFQFQFFAGAAICTAQDSETYNLRVKIANKSWETKKPVVVGHNFVRWNVSSDQTEIMLPYKSVKNIGSIFIYLCDSKGRQVSYAKFQAEQFNDPDAKLQWIEFTPDPVLKLIDSPELGGLCSFRLSIVKGTKDEVQFKDYPEWKKKPDKRPKTNLVRAYIYQARNLPAADDDGASDPLIKVFDHWQTNEKTRKAKETRCVEDTVNPMFYECLELTIEGKIDELPPFVVDIYDVDPKLFGGSKRDYMCRAIIPIQEAALQVIQDEKDDTGIPPSPQWHKLYFKQGAKSCGEVLLSFVLTTEFEHNWKVMYNNIKMMGIKDSPLDRGSIVQFEEFNIEINVLGLRSLVSSGLLPVKKAYIQFGLKTLVPPIAGAVFRNITTTPGPSGPDPTINTVVSFKMLLPEDHKYSPSMACRVYDKIFTGLDGQLVGVFSIPIGEIMHAQREHYVVVCSKLRALIEELKLFRDEKVVPNYAAVIQKDPTQDALFKTIVKETKEESKNVFNDEKSKGIDSADQMLLSQKSKSMKKPLLGATDEASDDEGNQLVRPVGIDARIQPYEAPSLLINNSMGPNEVEQSDNNVTRRKCKHRVSEVETVTRRSAVRKIDQTIIMDVVRQEIAKQVDTLPKNVDPTDPSVFRPNAEPRVSLKKVEDAVVEDLMKSGVSVPDGVSLLEQFKSAILPDVSISIDEAVQKQLRLEQKEQQISEEHMNANDKDRANKTTLKPEYKLDERLKVYVETNQPPINKYEPVGWDRIPTQTHEKHYRRFYTQELENVKEVMKQASDFNQYKLSKGQVRGASGGFFKGLFGGQQKDESGEVSTAEEVGLFKAMISITRSCDEEEQRETLNELLQQVFGILCEIHQKKFNSEFPFDSSVFGQAQKLNNNQGKNSTPTPGPNTKKLSAELKSQSLLHPEGRIKFREKMFEMELTRFQISKLIMDIQSKEIMKRLLLTEKRTIVRSYILGAVDLAQRDNDSPSDPFIVLKLGNQVFNDRDNYIEDEPNPQIYKKIDFEAVFPGCPQLKVQMWDYDMLFGDDLIGETVIDLEDRYFSADWNVFINKPIEYRKLYHPSSKTSQGQVKMWVEILPTNQSKEFLKEYDISMKPQEEFEVRVVVWDSEELKMMDNEGMTDGFVKTFFDPQNVKETDTHFRNQDGHCSWNYRILHKVKYPSREYNLTTQAFDKDLFSGNDFIGDAVLNLKPLIEDASLTKSGVSLNKDYYEEYLKKTFPDFAKLTFESDGQSFWVNLYSKEKGKVVINGKLRLSIDVVPMVVADKNRVGEAQSEPNCSPFLPKPTGRMELSLNPLKMLQQLIGPQFLRMGSGIICTVLCCALCIFMLPMILSDFMSTMLMNIF